MSQESPFRVERIEGSWRTTYPSEFSHRDPDWERDNEHRVVEVATGRVALRFPEHEEKSGDGIPPHPPTGVARVRLDGEYALVAYHDGRLERVALQKA